MPAEPIGEDNPIEAILLTAFPNPDRIGCPGAEVIEGLGNQRLGRDDPAWSHIWNCSPCFRDFKVIRDARVTRVEHELSRKRTRRNILTGASAVAISYVAAYFAASQLRSGPRHGFEVVSIDLTNAGATRGSTTTESVVARLPRHLDELHLTLDRLSSPGRYVVAVLESQSQGTAVALGSAMTQRQEGRPTLVIGLDLSEVRPGKYFLGIRRENNGQEEIANYYPVVIV